MEKQQFIHFLGKAAKFLLVLIIIDLTLGSFAEYLFFKQKSGKFARINQTLRQVEADVFIFGSSHANRHFVPAIFEQKLGLTFYNAGVQGQEIMFHTVLAEIVLNRTSPRFIILNIDPYWMFESKGPYERLSNLNPYYGEYPEIIKPTIRLKTKLEPIKNLSKAYRFNSTMVHIIKYFLIPQPDQKGFRPLGGAMSANEIITSADDYQIDMNNKKIDPNCVNSFERFLLIAKEKNVKLILVASPHVSGDCVKNKSSDLMNKIIEKHNIPLLDFTSDKHFTDQYELFNNPSHLNKWGAYLFSNILADSLNKKINGNIFAKSNVISSN